MSRLESMGEVKVAAQPRAQGKGPSIGQYLIRRLQDYKLGHVFGIPGDYNADGHVDAGDYVRWRNTLGDTGKFLAADGDGDEEIGIGDYAYWKLHYGESFDDGPGAGGLPASSTVPEPTATGPCGLALLSLLAMRGVRRAIRGQ